MASSPNDTTPAWSWLIPIFAAVLLGLKLGGIASDGSIPVQLLATALLGGSVFAAVHHAEVLALRLGEPFGSILLAVAVTVIEVGLIIAVLLSGAPGTDAVARDTVYSAVMIVLNGIVGLCLVVGASRHGEQSFQLQGASAALNVLAPLAVMAMILPNFTPAVAGPYYSHFQLLYVGAMSFALYAMFVFIQTVRHRDYFLEAITGADDGADAHGVMPSGAITAASAVLLPVALCAVVFLAKLLSHPLEDAISSAGLPHAVLGVVIALIVMLPEGLASVRAARANRLQNSLNLALGSAIASIGLTIPTVAVASLIGGRELRLGLDPEHMILLMLSLFVSSQTLSTGRTTVLQGGVHLVIFAVFLMITATP